MFLKCVCFMKVIIEDEGAQTILFVARIVGVIADDVVTLQHLPPRSRRSRGLWRRETIQVGTGLRRDTA